MDLPESGDATSRFLAFLEVLTSVIGHANRAKPLRDYCIGLMDARRAQEHRANSGNYSA